MKTPTFTIALAGNPNSGKTTIFNAITGSRQHVANYPGVTVETKQGRTEHNGVTMEVVDLPGTYSLTAYSTDEIVARNFLIDQKPDVVVDIIDSANLERNLYLATQLIELGVPLVLAFNMSDIAVARGYDIDEGQLSELLGVPIVKTTGHKSRGISELLDTVVQIGRDSASPAVRQHQTNYGSEIEPHVKELARLITYNCRQEHRSRWFALKLLEGDEETARRMKELCPDSYGEVFQAADNLRRHIESVCGDSAEIVLANRRYGYISGACAEAVRHTPKTHRSRSDKIDTILTNRWLGLPFFVLMMYLVFQLTFTVGNYIVNTMDVGKDWLADAVRALDGGGQSLLISLLADGIIEGVGAVLVFVPLILLLYMAIAILEDSGYMARAAFVIDWLMHKMGLHGKSFVPMLIGFGCTVPAVMATRTLRSRRDRMTTMMVLPLISCGARLPIYLLIIGAFFPSRTVFSVFGLFDVTNQALWLFGIYALGIILAIVCARIFRATLFRGEASPLVMELPPYRLPTLKGLVVHMWERTWMYIKKAGTIILAIMIILWALQAWPGLDESRRQAFAQQRQAVTSDASLTQDQQEQELTEIDRAEHEARLVHSSIGRIGKFLAPVFRPCGFDWKITTALLPAFAAKEVFVGQLGIIHSLGEQESESESLRKKLAATYSPLQGVCIMLFCLISMPCVATMAVTIRESGSWKWGLFQLGYLTAMAWLVAMAVYQIGTLLGLGATPAII